MRSLPLHANTHRTLQPSRRMPTHRMFRLALNFSSPGWRWLLVEGLLPLAGAGVLYLLWGVCRLIVRNTPRGSAPFRYSWGQALDPFGWLYGAIIISVQSALISARASDSTVLTTSCCVGAGACVLLLLAAMNERGSDPAWQPSARFQWFAALLVVAILFAGYRAHGLSSIRL